MLILQEVNYFSYFFAIVFLITKLALNNFFNPSGVVGEDAYCLFGTTPTCISNYCG
jgi:hypothetical protein